MGTQTQTQTDPPQEQAPKPAGRQIAVAVAYVFGAAVGYYCGWQLVVPLALESYRSGKFSRAQVRNLLGLSWQATEEFLARHDAYRHYSLEDLETDRQTLQAILPS